MARALQSRMLAAGSVSQTALKRILRRTRAASFRACQRRITRDSWIIRQVHDQDFRNGMPLCRDHMSLECERPLLA